MHSYLQELAKTWSKTATRQYKIEEATNLFIRTISSSSDKLGSVTHSVDFFRLLYSGCHSDIDAPSGLFMSIAKFCPNIKRMETTGIWVNSDFYEMLLREFTKNGNFKHLERIPFPSDEEDIAYYVPVALALRKNRTFLFVGDKAHETDGEFSGGRSEEYDTLSYSLRRFRKVKSLHVVRHCNQGINKYSELFSDCPSLESLEVKIFSFFAEYDYHPDGPCLDKHKYGKYTCEGAPNPKIREFKGTFVIYGDKTLKSIINSLPNLKKLVINGEGYCDFETLKYKSRVSNNWRSKYFDFILRVPTFMYVTFTSGNQSAFWHNFWRQQNFLVS